jgi:PAS domain S-box-containing protein
MDGSRKEQIEEIAKLGRKISESGGSAPEKAGKADLMFEREEQFREFFNKMPDAVMIVDRKGTLLEASEMAEKMTGYRKGELMGKSIITGMELMDAKTKAMVIKKMALYFSGKEIPPFEIEMRTKSGGTIPLEINPQIIDYMGKKAGLVVLRDITERKKAEAMLKKQQEEQQIILDSVPAWIFYKDKENRFIRVNKSFAEIMGMPKEKLEGKSLFDLYPKEQAEAFWKDDKEVMSSGNPKRNIIEPMKAGKGTLWVQTDKIPYRDEKDNIIGIIGFTIDITERKKAEEELKKLNEELKSKVEELEKINNFSVGRELKMVELKNRVKELEEKAKR